MYVYVRGNYANIENRGYYDYTCIHTYCSPSPSPVSGRVASHDTCVVLYAEPLRIVSIPDQSKHLNSKDRQTH